jgi:hypothetical protein
MVRRRWLIVRLALVGVPALLAFPASGSALLPTFVVSLTPTGPSPMVMREPAGYPPVVFSNTDTVTHMVDFANGSCSLQVAPGSRDQCSSPSLSYVGEYPYTVDGTSQGQLVVEAIRRSVSLFGAGSHTIDRGSRLTLHGRLQDVQYGSPPNPGSPQPIVVLARPDRYHAFHRIAVVRAKLHTPKGVAPFLGKLLWQLRVRPRATTIYIAEANYQPQGGQVWQRAWSRPLRARVRH